MIAVANFSANRVKTFTFTVTGGGTVAAADTQSTGGNVAAVAFSPNGQFVAASENTVGRLVVWSVNAAGTLTPAPRFPDRDRRR